MSVKTPLYTPAVIGWDELSKEAKITFLKDEKKKFKQRLKDVDDQKRELEYIIQNYQIMLDQEEKKSSTG